MVLPRGREPCPATAACPSHASPSLGSAAGAAVVVKSSPVKTRHMGGNLQNRRIFASPRFVSPLRRCRGRGALAGLRPRRCPEPGKAQHRLQRPGARAGAAGSGGAAGRPGRRVPGGRTPAGRMLSGEPGRGPLGWGGADQGGGGWGAASVLGGADPRRRMMVLGRHWTPGGRMLGALAREGRSPSAGRRLGRGGGGWPWAGGHGVSAGVRGGLFFCR